MSASSIGLSEDLYDYMIDRSVREPDVVTELRRKTGELSQGWWRTSPEQCQFMGLLAQISGVKRYLEVGTFTGYGTLWMALALGDGSEIITCDLTDEFAAVGQPFWAKAGVDHRIDFRVAPALETLDGLIGKGQAGTFDMAFIDADKETYQEYYERCLELVRPGGLILVDNVLWGGAVIDPDNRRRSTLAIRALNDTIRDDDRVQRSMIPIGDGLTIARKI